jgi:hypothetical protein
MTFMKIKIYPKSNADKIFNGLKTPDPEWVKDNRGNAIASELS